MILKIVLIALACLGLYVVCVWYRLSPIPTCAVVATGAVLAMRAGSKKK